MSPFSSEALQLAGTRLLDEIERLVAEDAFENPKDFATMIEKQARAISLLIKAGHDLTDFNDKMTKRNDSINYTRLEDLPPLHPDDEARLKDEFFSLVERVSQSEES